MAVNRTEMHGGDVLVIDVPQNHPDEPYLDWEGITIVIPAMGFIISDGVHFIRGKDDTWIWMICENVDGIMTAEGEPEHHAELNAIWQKAMGN